MSRERIAPFNSDERVSFTVPGIPPSTNHYVKHTRTGRHYVTSEAIEFKKSIALWALGRTIRGKEYGVELTIYLGKGQKGDIDNFAKVCLDGLKFAGVIDTDAKVTVLMMKKYRDIAYPRTNFVVMKFGE